MSYNMIGFTQDNKLMYYFADFRNGGNNYPDPATHGNYAINVDGSNKVFLGTSIYNGIAMAPAGDAVLGYSNASPQSRSITIYNLDGSTRLRLDRETENKILTNGLSTAGWSPDGKFLYMDDYIVDATTGVITVQVPGRNIIRWLPAQS
jgi:Tol biopolymer transport system component